jgi:hypothetical protein
LQAALSFGAFHSSNTAASMNCFITEQYSRVSVLLQNNYEIQTQACVSFFGSALLIAPSVNFK